MTTITVGSSLKFFGLHEGQSTGSELAISVEVEDGLSPKELRHIYMKYKRELDMSVLIQEYARGTVTAARFKEAKERLEENYTRLLGPASD